MLMWCDGVSLCTTTDFFLFLFLIYLYVLNRVPEQCIPLNQNRLLSLNLKQKKATIVKKRNIWNKSLPTSRYLHTKHLLCITMLLIYDDLKAEKNLQKPFVNQLFIFLSQFWTVKFQLRECEINFIERTNWTRSTERFRWAVKTFNTIHSVCITFQYDKHVI